MNEKWSVLKQNLQRHVMNSAHDEARVLYWSKTKEGADFVRENWRVCKILGRKVLKNIQCRAPFTTFPVDIYIAHKEGLNVGYQNHSSTHFPPVFLDCLYEALVEKIIEQLKSTTPYGKSCPFSVTADKDKAKKRSKQLMDVTMPIFQTHGQVDYNARFIQRYFVSHPSATDVTGLGLAELIINELKTKLNLNLQNLKECAGLCGDGQYIKNHVCHHFETLIDIKPVIECWDQPHTIEKLWKYALRDVKVYETLKENVESLVVLVAGAWQETYLEKAAADIVRSRA